MRKASAPGESSLSRKRRITAPYAHELSEYAVRQTTRLNVPGHASDPEGRSELHRFFGGDILRKDVPPLLPGLDKGPGNALATAKQLAALAWRARRTWFLTNGASQANRMVGLALASFRAAADPVVIQRSAHSSVMDGVILADLAPVFVMPTVDPSLGIAHGVSAAALAGALRDVKDPKAVYITSPSYFGAVSDIRELARIAHAHGAALIVDGAWGSHFGFHPDLPENPLDCGADVVVTSTHKLGGSLTQSAMLHVAETPHGRELEPLIDRALSLTQSTSESSLLLASLDLARAELSTGGPLLSDSLAAASTLRRQLRESEQFDVASDGFPGFADVVDIDPLRVPIALPHDLDGHHARDALMSRGVFVEIATDRCIVAVVGPGSALDVERFVEELHLLPRGVRTREEPIPLPTPGTLSIAPRTAFFLPSVTVAAEDAVGLVSAETLAAYPPGIPNVVPGEVITAELVRFLRHVSEAPGGHVRGASDPSLRTLRVVAPQGSITNREARGPSASVG